MSLLPGTQQVRHLELFLITDKEPSEVQRIRRGTQKCPCRNLPSEHKSSSISLPNFHFWCLGGKLQGRYHVCFICGVLKVEPRCGISRVPATQLLHAWPHKRPTLPARYFWYRIRDPRIARIDLLLKSLQSSPVYKPPSPTEHCFSRNPHGSYVKGNRKET